VLLAFSAFQNLENFVKLKISQANLPGAPELIEEVDDENAEVDAKNGQHEDENEELEQPYQKLQHERLKLGMEINKDMDQIEPAVLEYKMNMKVPGTARTAEGLCSENLNPTMAIQNFSNVVAVQNRNGTTDLDNMNCNMDVHSLASSISTREDCPDMDDYDQTLMELGEWQPF
jgi:hypothetical protein